MFGGFFLTLNHNFVYYVNFPGDVALVFPIYIIVTAPAITTSLAISQAKHLGAILDSSVICQEE